MAGKDSYSNPILSKPSNKDLSSLPLNSEKGFADASPADVLYICFTSTPSVLGNASSTLGLLGCCVRAVSGVVGVLGADPLAGPLVRGRCHLRLGGGGIIVDMLYLCVRLRGVRLLQVLLVEGDRRDTRREEANGRSKRERETNFIVF
jgi:hypothetical protein